jgi:hypothetical protein
MKRAVLAFSVIIVLAGCGAKENLDERRGRSDAPVANVDDTPKDVIQAPDRFSNVTSMCDGHGFRIFVTTKSDASRSLFVVEDENCTRPDHSGHVIHNSDDSVQSNTNSN